MQKGNNSNARPTVSNRTVGNHESGQRLDNYLIKILKGVPKSRIYKAVRGGEVRINGSRVKPSQKILAGDLVRIPPIRVAQENNLVAIPPKLLAQIPTLFEDEHLLIVDKPSGLAVHGGSGIEYGLIEALRQLASQYDYLELVHRLDRETSGCLMLAKNRQALLGLQHDLANARKIRKCYQALVLGGWEANREPVDLPLQKQDAEGAEKRMVVSNHGQKAKSIVSLREIFRPGQNRESNEDFNVVSLVDIELRTGRMHQARAHCSAKRHPIAGDRLYGDKTLNKWMTSLGLGRLFLHASELKLTHPVTGENVQLSCSLPDRLQSVIDKLRRRHNIG